MGRQSQWVICKVCGRKFDFGKSGGAYDGNRYLCQSCSNNVVASGSLNGEIVYLPRQKSWFRANWKIFVAAFFLIGGFGSIGTDGRTALISILIGTALLVKQYYPSIRAARQKKTEREADLKVNAREAELREQEIAFQTKAEEPKRCKSCGAISKGKLCEYCGSLLD